MGIGLVPRVFELAMAQKRIRNGADTGPRRTSIVVSVGVALSTTVAATAIGRLGLDHRLPDIVMLYLLGVVVTAMRFDRVTSLMTATLGVAAFDFFFLPPYLSLAITDKRFVFTLGIMLFVAVVISALTDQVRRGAAAATERERRTATLYAMSRELATSASRAEIARVSSRHLREVFASNVWVLVPSTNGGLRPLLGEASSEVLDAGALARAQTLFPSSTEVSPESRPITSKEEQMVALHGSRGILGILVVHPANLDFFENVSNRNLLGMFAAQIALALERAQTVEDEQRAKLEIETERLRSALLSSVSHDLRTPLAVIKGAATALLESFDELSAGRRQEYMETISEEANRLNQLVRNLLNMTALEAHTLRVDKEWHLLEEVIGVALTRLAESLKERPVEVAIPSDALWVPLDASLIEQVFINLVENAIMYAPGTSAIEIRARRVENEVEIEVADHGPGIPLGEEQSVFAKFHRAASTAGGMGLGLTICKGIVTVHGGRIWCENRAGGGAVFRFVLPAEGQPPVMNVLPEAIRDVDP
jgi:two-component system, OmpR family, sensor histidine kinase KdpD